MSWDNFKPVTDPAIVDGCVAAILDAQTKPINLPPTWPSHHPPRMQRLLALRVGEAIIFWNGVHALVARASQAGRVFKIEPRPAGGHIVERVS